MQSVTWLHIREFPFVSRRKVQVQIEIIMDSYLDFWERTGLVLSTEGGMHDRLLFLFQSFNKGILLVVTHFLP